MKKSLFIAFALLTMSLVVMAVPAKKGVYKTLTLSDGTTVRAMLVGDEHGHFWRADDGQTYVQKNGIYQTVDTKDIVEKAKARRLQSNALFSRRLSRTRGLSDFNHYYDKKKGIIILVNYADVQFKDENDNALFQRIVNEPGFSEGDFKGSMADYFRDQSRGKFELEFDVVGPVTVSKEAAYYGSNDEDGNDMHAAEMVCEAVTLAMDQVKDWKQYDWDGDHYVDQVYVIYAGNGAADGGGEDTIWPHAYDLYSSHYYGDGTGPVEVDVNLKVNTYACGPELDGGGKISGIGTMCHEFSHCLGYPDFYDIDYSGGQGMLQWDLMDGGSYNGNGYQPAGYTSYERWVVGWMDPIELSDEDKTIEDMKSLQNGGESYIIYNKGNPNEYYLLENRQLEGWDASLPSAGLLIIHVDYDKDVWYHNQPNDDITHQRMTVVPADGDYKSQYYDDYGIYYFPENIVTDPFPQGDVTAFNKRFKTYDPQAKRAAKLFNPNENGKFWIDSSVENIKQNGDKTISFNFVANDTGKEPEDDNFSIMAAGKVNDIKPQGWLQTLLQRQHDGLTGHPEALSYPYNSCLWAGEISRPDETYGDNWWRYEQTAYYTDGLLRLGYELGDEEMVAKAMEGIEYTLTHPDENGVLGNATLMDNTWPMSVFFRVLQAKYEHDGDERIPQALEKYYLNFTPEDLAGGVVGGRNIMSLEGILWTYGKTGNAKLLQLAEDAWAIQDKFALDETAITGNEPFYMHSVTFCEMLKLPLLLYAYTGNERYHELALMAIDYLEMESMLPDGVPSSAEFLLGNDVDISHETCVIVDYTWTLSQFLSVLGEAEWADKMELAVYNAGLGAITKDFRSLQYFSSLNQFIATGTSNHNIYKHGSTWMAYRPTHETECCSGNVNRMLPNFVSRMWLTDVYGGAVAALYGPSTATFKTDKGDITITCETDYPFADRLTFTVTGAEEASIPLTLRIPSWCTDATLTVNDNDVGVDLYAGTFVNLPDKVRNGDIIVLTLPMTVEKKTIEGQGVCFQRGPLLYAYAIPQQKTEDTEEYANMHGKKPENPDFKCWNITPTGDFNYAFADDGTPLEANYPDIEEIGGTIPFDLNYTPVKVRIPVKQIEWNLVDDRYTPEMPEQGHLTLLSDETKYIDLVPYGCTELRLTVFPDAYAEPMEDPEEPDYTRPDDAPDCVEVVDGCYYAYFEEPRFCWDEPIFCKVRTVDDTVTDLHSSQEGDMCVFVGETDNGRIIWQWIGPSISEATPVEIIFTNHDLLTGIMPFVNGGYYNYESLLYMVEPSEATAITQPTATDSSSTQWFSLDGRRLTKRPTAKGVYIQGRKKVVIK